jgi:uncharacterized protein (DUF427 family)
LRSNGVSENKKSMRPKKEKPGPDQESVWDYPRPPRLEDTKDRVRVVAGGITVADSAQAKRVLETSHPPVYYIPPQDVKREHLQEASHRSWCEWKGEARYYALTVPGKIIEQAAWCYPSPSDNFASIAGYFAFYPSKVDACYVGDELVKPQPGDFYGGWITSRIVGPFKGPPGTFGW